MEKTRARRICSVEGCGRIHVAKGFCRSHYQRFVPKTDRRIKRTPDELRYCRVTGCDRPYYAKGYCHTHHVRALRGTINKGEKLCAVLDCSSRSFKDSPFCNIHKTRWETAMGVNIASAGNKGERNWRWNGGTSYYPNHYTMKALRKIKVRETGGRCELCGAEGRHLHHKDGSKDKHSLENFTFLCIKCHSKQHLGRRNASQYKRVYGISAAELADRFHVSVDAIRWWHKKGVLQGIISSGKAPEKIKKNKPVHKTVLFKRKGRFVGNLNYQSAPKFIRLYGKTLRDLSMDLRVPIPSVWQLHKTGQLGAVVSQVTSA
jgi:hypothetical protein